MLAEADLLLLVAAVADFDNLFSSHGDNFSVYYQIFICVNIGIVLSIAY